MKDYKYSAIIDCDSLNTIHTFVSNDFSILNVNLETLERMLSALNVEFTVYFDGATYNAYLDSLKYEKNNHSEEQL